MPTYSIDAPNGLTYEIDGPEGASQEDVIRAVLAQHPGAQTPRSPKSGFAAAFKAGVSGLKGAAYAGAGRTGVISPETAAEGMRKAKEESAAAFRPTEEGWTEAPFTKAAELAGQSLPYMAAPLAAGAAAAFIGAPAVVGAGAAGLASMAQFTGTNLQRQTEGEAAGPDGAGKAGVPLMETDLTAAAAAAVPQAALDMLSFKMAPGIRMLFAKTGTALPKQAAEQIASQSLKKAAVDYAAATGKAMTAEGLTETAQQVLERMQAGLSLTDKNALEEYKQSLIGGAVLGGAMAPAGRFVERGKEATEQKRVAAEQQAQVAAEQEQAAAAQAQAAAAQEAQQAQVEAEQRASPAYFQQRKDALAAMEQQHADLLARYPKPAKDASALDRATYADGMKQAAALAKEIKKTAQEVVALQKMQPASEPEVAVGTQAEIPMPEQPKPVEVAAVKPVEAPVIEPVDTTLPPVEQHAALTRQLSGLETVIQPLKAQIEQVQTAVAQAPTAQEKLAAMQPLDNIQQQITQYEDAKQRVADVLVELDKGFKQHRTAVQNMQKASEEGDLPKAKAYAQKVVELEQAGYGVTPAATLNMERGTKPTPMVQSELEGMQQKQSVSETTPQFEQRVIAPKVQQDIAALEQRRIEELKQGVREVPETPVEHVTTEGAYRAREASVLEGDNAMRRAFGLAEKKQEAAIAAEENAAHDAAEAQLRYDPFAGEHEASAKELPAVESAPLAVDTAAAVHDGRTVDVMTALETAGTTPFVREAAAKLRPFLLRTRLQVTPDLAYDGVSVAGLYTHHDNTVQIHPEAMNELDLLHEMTHAATMRALTMPEERLSTVQVSARKALEALHAQIQHHPDFVREYGRKDVKELVSEVYTNPNLLTKLDALAPKQHWGQKLLQFLKRLVGLHTLTVSQRAKRDVEALFMPSRRAGQDRVAPSAPTPKTRNNDYGTLDSTPLGQLARRMMPERDTRSVFERLTDNLGLRFETAFVDMRAPVMQALDTVEAVTGDHDQVFQARYFLRKEAQRSNIVVSALSIGAPEMYKDGGGFIGIQSRQGPSAMSVMQAIDALPVDTQEGKVDLASAYLLAVRGQRVGVEKIGTTKAEVAQVLQQVAADPALKKALDTVRGEYTAYNEKLITFLRDSGAISKAKAAELISHKDYIPAYRVVDGKVEMGFGDGSFHSVGDISSLPHLHALKGGKQAILPLNESIILNTKMVVDMAMDNLAARNIAYVMQAVGKPVKKMQIQRHQGQVPTGKDIIQFRQEPAEGETGPHAGQRWMRIDTEGTMLEGLPPEVLGKSIEGVHYAMPSMLTWLSKAGDWLRAGVTRVPIYTVRQLVRDPAAAAMTSGLDIGPLRAVAAAGKEYAKSLAGMSETNTLLNEKALVQSNLLTGDMDDIAQIAKDIAHGKNPNALRRVLNALDKNAHLADAATRALVWENAKKNGLSDVKAEYAVIESMNFHKRGASESIQWLTRMIPFMNAQIQGLNVLVKAAQGKMPFEERLSIQRKLLTSGAMLMVMGFAYGVVMQDDETYKRATPKERYSNILLPMPVGDAHLRVPVPYEIGVLTLGLGQALADLLVNDEQGSEVARAAAAMTLSTIPGGASLWTPQGVKQAFEVLTNKSFSTMQDIVPGRLQRMDPAEQYNTTTPGLLRAAGQAAGVSPLKMQHVLNGLFGQGVVALMQVIDELMPGVDVEKADRELHQQPLVGGMFANPEGAANVDTAYRYAEKAMQARQTLRMLETESMDADKIRSFVQEHMPELRGAEMAGEFTKSMGELSKAERQLRNMPGMTGEDKRTALKNIAQAKQILAARYAEVFQQLEEAGAG